MNDVDTLILEHMQQVELIASIMNKKCPMVERSELVSIGSVGLIQAANSFDPGRGYKFATYADRRICGAIQDYLRDIDPLTRGDRRKLNTLKLEGKDESESARLLKLLEKPVSLDAPFDGTGFTLDSTLQSMGDTPEQCAIRSFDAKYVRDLILRLPYREQFVVVQYYFEEHTMKEIGQLLGVNETRISQLHTRAMGRLRGFVSGKIARKIQQRTPKPIPVFISKTKLQPVKLVAVGNVQRCFSCNVMPKKGMVA